MRDIREELEKWLAGKLVLTVDPEDEPIGDSEPGPEPEPEPEPELEPKEEPEPEPEPLPVAKDDWRDKRLAKQTARIRELEAKINTAAGNPPVNTPVNDPAATEAEIDRRSLSKAEQIAAQREFDRDCLNAVNEGKKAFPDFDSRVNQLRKLVDGNDPQEVSQYNAFLVAALETGEASKLIYELGGDLNKANRILSLPPVKMAVELAKMAMGESPQVSGAPKPIRPVGDRGRTHDAINPADPDRADKLSTEEWMRRREADLAKRRA